MPVASSEDQVLIPGAFAETIRCNLTAASSLLAQGVPFVPEDRQREPADISIPRASVEAIRCNLTAAISVLTEGEPFVLKERQRKPTDETVVAEDLDGQEEAEEEEPRRGKYGGKGGRKGRSRGEPRDIDSCSRSHDRRGQSKGGTRGSRSRVAELGQVRPVAERAVSTRRPTQVYQPRLCFPTVKEAPTCLANAGGLLTALDELLRNPLVALLWGHAARCPFRSHDKETVEHPHRLSWKSWSHLQCMKHVTCYGDPGNDNMFASWKALTLRAGIAKPKGQLCSSCSASELPLPAWAAAGPKAVAFAMLQLLAQHGKLCASSETDWPGFAKREMCADMLEGLGGISQPDVEESLAMQEWLQKECVGSVFHEGSFQDLREQLSRLAVEMCNCWSQVHVDADVQTRWRLLYPLLCVAIVPSATLAASVET